MCHSSVNKKKCLHWKGVNGTHCYEKIINSRLHQATSLHPTVDYFPVTAHPHPANWSSQSGCLGRNTALILHCLNLKNGGISRVCLGVYTQSE